jgi:Leucine-rich repeat (LRR) protein
MVHDLARCNFENGCCSIDDGMTGKIPVFPTRSYHLYVDRFVKLMEPVLFDNFTTLRTLVVSGFGVKNMSAFDLSVAQKLRALEIECHSLELEFFSSLSKLKHLRYLSLGDLPFKRLPECICSLYNLQILKIGHCAFNELPTKIGNLVSLENLLISRCYDLRVLPESLCQLKALRNLKISWCNQLERLPTSIGNLVSLQKMEIKHCNLLKGLPESLCQLKALKELILYDCKSLEVLPSDVGSLTNLQILGIHNSGVGSLPPSWDKIIRIQKLGIVLNCETIGWLKDFGDLGGTLSISGLNNVSRLTDFMGDNLLNMPNLECLHLCWNYGVELNGCGFLLFIKGNQNTFFEDQNDSAVMASLQPHPNLRELRINGYGSITFAEWIGNPIPCASLERIVIYDCKNLTFLPFGSLYKLKYLDVSYCDSLQFLRAESLPLGLQELKVFECSALISVPGIQKLKSLVKLSIIGCGNLQWLLINAEPSVAPMMHTYESSSPSSLLGLRNLNLLRSLSILRCPKLQLLGDELLCIESCEVEVGNCPLVMEWCLQHRINYQVHSDPLSLDN